MFNSMTLIFLIIGIATGLAMTFMADLSIANKRLKAEIIIKPLVGKGTCVFLAIVNGLLWAEAVNGTNNIFTAILVSMLYTTAIIISIIDIKARIVPNELVILIASLGFLFQILNFGWKSLLIALICMLAMGSAFAIIGKFVGFGQVGAGDIKLAASIGLILGYPQINTALIVMSAALMIFCIGGLVIKKLSMKSTFPFAPFILFGTICSLVGAGRI